MSKNPGFQKLPSLEFLPQVEFNYTFGHESNIGEMFSSMEEILFRPYS